MLELNPKINFFKFEIFGSEKKSHKNIIFVIYVIFVQIVMYLDSLMIYFYLTKISSKNKKVHNHHLLAKAA